MQGVVTSGLVAPSNGLVVTLQSNSPNLLLSATASGAGSSTIQVTIPAGTNQASYYLQSTGSSGIASYTASASGFNSRTAMNITLTPSGFALIGPDGTGQMFPVTVSPGALVTLTVAPAQLDASGNFVQTEMLSGSVATISITPTVSGVGSVAPATVMIAPGSAGAVTQFSSATTGNSTVSISQPAGYTPPGTTVPLASLTSVQFIVQ